MVTPAESLLRKGNASLAWKNLEAHYRKMRDVDLGRLCADDSNRGERLTAKVAGLVLDYSKSRIMDETVELLVALAEECRLQERIEAMFRGDKINFTEGRAALHTALRTPRESSVIVDGENVVPKVHSVLDRMSDFSRAVRGGSGRAIRESPSAM